VDVLSAAGANYFVNTILDNKELACIKDHANVGVREVILLITTTSPGDF
jgi:hypothetical protein